MTRVYEPFNGPSQPDLRTKRYMRTTITAPAEPLIELPRTATETSGPVFGVDDVGDIGVDLTNGNTVLGSLSIISGQVMDEDGRPVANALVEFWQANASGKYPHEVDTRPAPDDPHFTGAGRMLTDAEGRYRFTTISLATRLVTQMYFPGDPLNAIDGILQAIPDADARTRLIAQQDQSLGIHEHALGYRFDIVLRGRAETPMVG